MASNDHQQETSYIRIPVSQETLERLMRLADMCHADPVAVAASMLHDVLKDDEEAHPLELLPVTGMARA